ncbi:MAG: fold metallo-hydrolase [Caloramator sp.]|jgi:L-ascorbate metabolism protein UlaG (beta-lactamase superfamily)|uniref:MBL fold metallo-hydrolase n=1 Tax=Caloramator sp. TaxID=1871330 RepID=UPI001DAC9B48|nr:MBL fold metallo-hydrolase [Caloramator sp.]MBZ4664152.1 fold metallo-hydrolase [Caloramator sp.]
MRIKWLGHACFKITSKNGIRIVTDPFDDNVGYKLPKVSCDIVTTSHNHYDHNFTDCLSGDYTIVNKVGNFYIKDIAIRGVHTYHDEEQGAKRGDNIVYVFDVDGKKVCHLGDLGHRLTKAQIEMIGDVDVLLIPVGGIYTIDAEAARDVCESLNAKVIIPMHYKTKPLKFELNSVDKFLEYYPYTKLDKPFIEITDDMLKERHIYVLHYE